MMTKESMSHLHSCCVIGIAENKWNTKDKFTQGFSYKELSWTILTKTILFQFCKSCFRFFGV